MWAPLQLRIGWRDLLSGLLRCAVPGDRQSALHAVETYWPDDRTMAAYSVRSGLDLLLQSLDLKPGDEVLFSAINIRGMVSIVKKHGAVPVPVDLDIAHMAPDLDCLKRAITPRSRIFIAAHLFGARIDFTPAFEIAKKHGLFVFEDCAQAFAGTGFAGHPLADLSAFSFGPLKIATALGGALLRIREPSLLAGMRDIQAGYPIQSNGDHLRRGLKFAAFKLVMSRPLMGLISKWAHASGSDFDNVVGDRVRNVARLGGFAKLRYQPSGGLLRLLARRLANHDHDGFAGHAETGRRLRELIGDTVVQPAIANEIHNCWVFPVLPADPARFIEGLRRHGFYGTGLPRSKAVDAPADRPELEPKVAKSVMSGLVILPCYPQMPDRELVREAGVIRELASAGEAAVQDGEDGQMIAAQ